MVSGQELCEVEGQEDPDQRGGLEKGGEERITEGF